MAFKNFKGEIERNLQEQVRANKDHDIALAKEIQSLKTLVGFDIKVIERLDTWVEPTGSFAFGDAIAVGPEGGPFNFYIYTRYSANAENGYWLNYGPISIVGPQGPQGEPGPKGEAGKSSKWFVGPNEPTEDVRENDMWLKLNSDYSTNGLVYQYRANGWALFTSIMGPRGLQGPEGKAGKQGPIGPTGPQGPAGNPSPVINIIGELPEGSIISETYDPALVASNSGILMPVSGVNHLWIIVNGRWIDSGSWGQGGTRVYVGGEEVVEFNADTKLDIRTERSTYNQVYTKLTNGTQAMLPVATAGTREGNAIARYSPSGQLETSNPVKPYQCANKQYVDNAIARAHGELQHTVLEWFKGQPLQFQVDLGVYINPSMPSMPNAFQLYGIGGYVLSNGGYWSNGPSTNELSFSMTDSTIKLTSYNPGSTTGSILGQFQINDYTINGTVATFILTANDFGPDGGIFTFDCIPHSPSNS